jgi:hypothetical protein
MNIIKTIDQCNMNSIYFCEPIKNNVIINGSFTRILYSSDIFTMNGVYLMVPLNDIIFEKYYQKYKCTFNSHSNMKITNKICEMEFNLLQKAGNVIKNKTPQYKIQEQFKNSHIKIVSENMPTTTSATTFLLKISGIWETETQYGVTYKFSVIA